MIYGDNLGDDDLGCLIRTRFGWLVGVVTVVMATYLGTELINEGELTRFGWIGFIGSTLVFLALLLRVNAVKVGARAQMVKEGASWGGWL